jgi:hypothetical protein
MSDTITKYNLLSDLPSIPEIGENAFVEETSKTYRSQDLSTIISNSFEFSGNNSFLRTNGFTNTFTNENDTWAIEFWSYIISNNQDYPIFSLQKNIDNPSYSFSDVTGTYNLSHTNLKAFNFSPYNAHTSSARFDNANIKTDNPLTGFNYHDDFSISFWTYPINTSYTLVDFTKTDEDKTTLRLTNNKIVDNGVDITIDNSHSFGNNNWHHNTLSYDGFDYSLFLNDSSVGLTRYIANDIDSNNQLSITDLNINQDIGFKCKISFGLSPSDSTLFEFGEADRYVKLSIINSGNTLEFRANGTNPLIITTNNFPKDNNTHIVSWDIRISPERIRLWIDDELKGTASTASTIENGVWANGIVQSRSTPVSSFFKRRTTFLQTNQALSYYNFRLQSQSYFWYAPTIVDTGFTINTDNGDNIYYYEFIMTRRNSGANRDMEFYLVDTSQYTLPRYGRAVNNQTTTHARTSFTSYNHVLRPGDIISVFISEQTKQVSMYRNGTDNLWRSFGFSGLPGTSAYQGWSSNYCSNEFRVEHSPSRWVYGPTHSNFLNLSVQNRLYAGSTKVGAYGLSVNNNVGSDSFSGNLLSKLRIYPQTFGSLSSSTFNIGSNYDLNGATSSNYKGYIKDFEVRDTKSLTNTPPTSPISSTASTNFLLNQTTDEQIILDYRSDGSIKVNDRIEFNIGDSNDNNTWLHTALVYDGTNLNVYKDGSPIGQTSNFSLEGNTLSNGEIELGITSDRNINLARYDKSYLDGYIKEFILHDSARYNASFLPLSTNYISGNEILLTATETNVPDDGTTFIKEGTVTSESFSPYTASDLGWIENGTYIKTNRTANIVTKNSRDILQIDVDSYAQPQSFLLTLDNRDKENNLINWSIDEWQTAPFTIIKQNNNNILIEPQSIDSYQDEQRLLNLRIVGQLADGSLPSYSQFGIFAHSNVELNFTYRNYSMVSEINSSNILDNTFSINVADSTDIANFTSIAPRPFRTVGDMITDSGNDIQIFDSPGALP